MPRLTTHTALGVGAARPARWTRWSVALALAALCVGAGVVRVVPALPVVFPGDGAVRLLGADAYYHLRQARRIAPRLPVVERRDTGTLYPRGDHAASTGLFAVGLAAVARAVDSGPGAAPPEAAARPAAAPARGGPGGSAGADGAAYAAAWSGPVLAALAVLALFALARPWLGARGALLAAAFFLLAPGPALPVSLLGFADHHAAEIVLALATAAGLARCARRASADPDGPGWRPALLDALPLALFAFVWLGAALYVALAALSLTLWSLVETLKAPVGASAGAASPAPSVAARTARCLGLAVLAWVLPAALLAPWLVMSPYHFRVYIGACAALVVGPGTVESAGRALRRRGVGPGATASALGLALVAGLGAILALEGVPPSLAGGIAALGKVLAPRTPSVSEHADLGPLALLSLFGGVGLLAACAPVVHVVRIALRRAPAWTALPAVFALGLAFVSLLVNDFAYALAPFVALLAASFAAPLLRRSRPAAVVLVLALALPVWPLGWVWSPWPARTDVEELVLVDDAWHETLAWLRQHSPATGDYGVVAPWSFGHAVAALAGRPPVWSHGFDAEEAAWWLLDDEQQALARLCPDCRGEEHVRYVVVDARTVTRDLPARMRATHRRPGDYLAPEVRTAGDGRPVPVLAYSEVYRQAMGPRLLLGRGEGLRRFRLVFAGRHESCVVTRLARRRVAGGDELRIERVAADLVPGDREAAARCDGLAVGVVRDAEGRLVYDALRVPSVAVFEVLTGREAKPAHLRVAQAGARGDRR